MQLHTALHTPIRFPQRQVGPYTVRVNMAKMRAPSSGSVRRVKRTLCVNHFLGSHQRVDRKCTSRHDDINETTLLGILPWLPDLDTYEEMTHMNGFQGRLYWYASYHPTMIEQMGGSQDPYLLRTKIHEFRHHTALTKGFMDRPLRPRHIKLPQLRKRGWPF